MLTLKNTNRDSTKAETLRGIAVYYMRNNVDSAVVYAQLLIELGNRKKQETWKGNGLNIKALAASNKGNTESAIKIFMLAHDAFKQAKDERGIGVVLSNLGNIYHNQSKDDKALIYYHQALVFFEKLKQPNNIARTFNGIAASLGALGQYDEAKSYQEKALVILKTLGDKEAIGFGFNNLAEIYSAKGDDESAMKYYKEAEKILGKIGEKRARSYALLAIAEIELDRNNTKKALIYALDAWELAQNINLFYELEDAANVLHTIYASQGNFQKAYEFSLLSIIYSDSIRGQDKYKKTLAAEAQSEYKFKEEKLRTEHENEHTTVEKKLERQQLLFAVLIVALITISLLTYFIYRSQQKHKNLHTTLDKQHQEIQQQQEELIAQAEALEDINLLKDKIFSVIANDLREPIRKMEGIMTTLHNPENMNKENDFAVAMNKQVNHTAYLIDNLLAWAKTQRQGEYKINSQFDLLSMITLNTENVIHLIKEKNIKIVLPKFDNYCVIADKNMTDLVIKNLIINAIKHTHQSGTISIMLEGLQNGFLVCSIKDSGNGITLDKINKIFDKKYLTSSDINSTRRETGLGLLLCKEFVEKNGGKIWVESKLGKGSTFCFTLKTSAELKKT